MFVSVDSGTVSYTRVWLEQKFGILATAAVEFAVVVFTSFLQRLAEKQLKLSSSVKLNSETVGTETRTSHFVYLFISTPRQ